MKWKLSTSIGKERRKWVTGRQQLKQRCQKSLRPPSLLLRDVRMSCSPCHALLCTVGACNTCCESSLSSSDMAFFFPSKETSFHNGRNFPKDLDTIYTFLLIFTNQNLNYSAQVSKEYLYNKVLINILLLSYYMRLNRDLPCSSQASKIQILFQKPLPFPQQPRDVLWPPGDPHIAPSPQMHVVQPS